MADVPVNDEVPSIVVDVVSNGQTVFDYDFRADEVGDLRAQYRYANGDVLDFIGGVDFVASGLGTAAGGTITLATFTATVLGDKLAIYRSIAIKRETDYSRDLFADDLNQEQDTLFMIAQELRRDVDRSVKVEIGDTPQQFPEPDANKVIGWSTGGTLANMELVGSSFPFGDTGMALAGAITPDEAIAAMPTALWDSETTRTMNERAKDVAWVGDFDIDMTGNNVSNTGLQAMFDETAARAELVPGIVTVDEAITYTRRDAFAGRGKKVSGAGPWRTQIRNLSNDKPIITFGDAALDRDALDCMLADLSIVGNALTTEGIACLGDDDDGLTQASRGVMLSRLRVTNVGAGPGIRWSAWKGRWDQIVVDDCLRGIDIGQHVYSLLSTGLYVVGATNEAIYAAEGLAGSKANALKFIGSVFQHCGASGQMVFLGGGATWSFDSTYLEVPSVGCTAAFRSSASARNVEIDGVNISTGGGAIPHVVESSSPATAVRNMACYGDVLSYVKLLGTSRRLIADQVDHPSGAVTGVSPIDISGATTPIIWARNVAGLTSRTPTTLEIGNNAFSIIDRSTGSPEGVVTAPPGSMVGVRSGADAGFWIKRSGAGNTGWAYAQPVLAGVTGSRPSHRAGLMYLDTTLNKPVWSDGTNWRDATGTIV